MQRPGFGMQPSIPFLNECDKSEAEEPGRVYVSFRGENVMNKMDLSNENTIDGPAGGHTEKFTAIYDRHIYSLLNFAKQLLNNKQDAEDVVADVFGKLWEMGDRLSSVQNVKAFLYMSVRNGCLSSLRHSQVRKYSQPNLEDGVEELNVPDEILIRNEYKNRLRSEIERLPPQCKAVFKMAIYEGRKTAEIAQILQLTPQTVTNYKVRAVQIIRSGWKVMVTALAYIHIIYL